MDRRKVLTHCVFILWLMLLSLAHITWTAETEELQELPSAISGKKYSLMEHGTVPNGYPIMLKEKNTSNVGILQEYEHKKMTFTLKNITDKTAKIQYIEPTCTCLTLLTMVENKELNPQEELPVNFIINASDLSYGAFERTLFISIEGFPVVMMEVTGEVVQSFDYNPSICIDLGAFYGDVPFKRTYRLSSRFEHDELDLLSPNDNPLFDLKLKKIEPKTFEIEVTPKKLPLPKRRFSEIFVIPATGVADFGPAKIAIKGIVLPRKFIFSKRFFFIDKAETLKGEPITISTDITIFPIEKQYRHVKNAYPKFVTKLPVFEEEKKYKNLTDISTWQTFAKDFTINNQENSVTIDKIPFDKGIKLNITFPANFFKDRSFFAFSANYGKLNIGTVQIAVR